MFKGQIGLFEIYIGQKSVESIEHALSYYNIWSFVTLTDVERFSKGYRSQYYSQILSVVLIYGPNIQ